MLSVDIIKEADRMLFPVFYCRKIDHIFRNKFLQLDDDFYKVDLPFVKRMFLLYKGISTVTDSIDISNDTLEYFTKHMVLKNALYYLSNFCYLFRNLKINYIINHQPSELQQLIKGLESLSDIDDNTKKRWDSDSNITALVMTWLNRNLYTNYGDQLNIDIDETKKKKIFYLTRMMKLLSNNIYSKFFLSETDTYMKLIYYMKAYLVLTSRNRGLYNRDRLMISRSDMKNLSRLSPTTFLVGYGNVLLLSSVLKDFN